MALAKLKNIYLLHGEEDFLIEEKISAIKKKIQISLDEPAEILKYDGENLTLKDISGFLIQQSLFLSKRLAVIYNFNFPEYAGFAEILKNIDQDLTLVLTAKKIDSRLKIFKFLKENVQVVEFKPFAPWESHKIISWINQRAVDGNKRIETDACDLLLQTSGPSLRLISSELEKIITYLGKREIIRKEDVLELAVSGSLSSFALLDALSSRNINKALSALNSLLRAKERPEAIVGSLASRIRLFLEVKEYGGNLDKAAQALGKSPYFLRQCMKAAEYYSTSELTALLQKLHEFDLLSKTKSISSQILLELLLVDAIYCKN